MEQSVNRGVLSAVETQRRIRDIALRLYRKRGRQAGHELEDWLEAERMLIRKKSS